MESLVSSPLLKVGLVFVFLVVLLRKGVQVGAALLLAGLALGFAFGIDPRLMARSMVSSVVELRALGLLLALSLIHLMSSLMENAGLSQGLIEAVRGRGRRGPWKMVLLPALVGLLPMPGGAYFSAPMVDGFDSSREISPSLKSGINYWFRHIWEYWWPLFPAVLLTCKIANIEVWKFSVAGFPLTLVAVGAGVPLLARLPRGFQEMNVSSPSSARASMWEPLLPMAMAIVPGVALSPLVRVLGGSSPLAQASREISLTFGLLLAILTIWIRNSRGKRALGSLLLDSKIPRMWITVTGVLCFKAVMEESGAAGQLIRELATLKVPEEVIAVFLPFLVGILSGLPIAFVGTCLPLVLSMAASHGGGGQIPWIVLTFVSGFVGSLLAPTHLCLVLSNEYFGTSYREVCKFLLIPCMLLMGGGIGYFALLRELDP